MIKEIFTKLSYAFFPRRCELCGEVCELDKLRCEKCLQNIRIKGEICDKCGCNIDDCKCDTYKIGSERVEYKAVVAPYYFKNNIISAVHRFKFQGFCELSEAMGVEVANTVKQRFSDVTFDLVTFVPLTEKRLKIRGYNQSLLLARQVAESLNIPCEETLIKVRDTKSQRSQSAKDRKLNVFGAYDLSENADIENKTVLIVDDVKTTGNTLSECSKILKSYKAKAVYAATFAIAFPD